MNILMALWYCSYKMWCISITQLGHLLMFLVASCTVILFLFCFFAVHGESHLWLVSLTCENVLPPTVF